MSFLIVDDNSVMRRTIRRVVSEFADEIMNAKTARRHYPRMENIMPDWVLMDVEMRRKGRFDGNAGNLCGISASADRDRHQT